LAFKLKIFDAFRPHEAQEALWAVLPVPGYVADPAKGSNHTRGVAVDLTLLDAAGKELDMGTPVDTMTAASHHFYRRPLLRVQLNRMYLLTIMLEAGFVHHPTSGGTTSCLKRRNSSWSAAVFAGSCLDAAA
jgi:D-alanyl-D-alanine dipeptidase